MKCLNAIAIAAAVLLCFTGALSQAPRGPGSSGSVSVRSCNDARISVFLSGWNGGFSGGTIFACAKVGMGPSQEALVYLSGQDWCGTGGCNLLVLAPTQDGYIIVSHIKTVWLPIRVLPAKTHGRNDLVVKVVGGGILRAYNALMTYDGKSYPPGGSDGTAIPAGGALGTVALSDSTPTHVM